MTYYNDIDPKACAWLRELIAAGHIAPGVVDCRSIANIKPHELEKYTQCHFFAGIGGWALALRLAGWPDNEPVWTGSCPCQPFSCAGQRKGRADERHLWPAFNSLIAERHPATIFGEQVAGKDGREWLAGVFADLEGMGYQRAAADLCAAGVGAPHIRQRLYWVANRNQAGRIHAAAGSPNAERNRFRTANLDGGTGDWLGEREPRRFEDGSSRRSKSGVAILVDGFPGRVDICGCFGNAIVPQVACEFIKAFVECSNRAARDSVLDTHLLSRHPGRREMARVSVRTSPNQA